MPRAPQQPQEIPTIPATEVPAGVPGELRLALKISEIMKHAKRIPKRGTAPQAMGGFGFVQVGDAADFIRTALGERKVAMVPNRVQVVGKSEHATAKGGVMTVVELVVSWLLTDGETGETMVIESYGAGGDTGDKFSGKAMSNAMKYAFLAGFQLSTGEDVELSDASDRRAAPPETVVTPSRGRASAPGGRQAEVSAPQNAELSRLLKEAGAKGSKAAATLIGELMGVEIPIDDADAPGSLAKWLDAQEPSDRGKLLHHLRGHVAKLKGASEEGNEAAGNGPSGGPDSANHETPAADLEAGDEV